MKEKKRNIIAIDGPAASGKSTVAAKVAKRLGAVYVNTGNMYRAITHAILEAKIPPSDEKKINELLKKINLEYRPSKDTEEIILNGERINEKIRSPEIALYVSKIASIPLVREWLVKKQRLIVDKNHLSVMEGRDIGTVVFPDAKWKFFLTASPEVRAKRRLEQSGENFEGATIATVAKEIAKRDEMDMNRSIAPLKKAEDAILIDSSDMTIDEVVENICKIIKIKEKI
ncbi:MAG TPA: (d)CMP kinase [Victivallales bacterium]|mgnify:CR=1 FL=1|nr:(d)CMP kinase [Victivallales bacterium]HPO90240.1 (d)CMP kinase [Victivallales bacterium]HRR05892.1 (d)CMP kinase [Victivallales bacterium]HRR28157.1 (d)CMP kinase [Victivallales bacterium]HRU00277.1 (d)CMP kinase [Victivallales bacterium]